jgi:hypothetical protein
LKRPFAALAVASGHRAIAGSSQQVMAEGVSR